MIVADRLLPWGNRYWERKVNSGAAPEEKHHRLPCERKYAASLLATADNVAIFKGNAP
jgi:hypothetical protein